MNDCDIKSSYCKNAVASKYYTCECNHGFQINPSYTNRCDGMLSNITIILYTFIKKGSSMRFDYALVTCL